MISQQDRLNGAADTTTHGQPPQPGSAALRRRPRINDFHNSALYGRHRIYTPRLPSAPTAGGTQIKLPCVLPPAAAAPGCDVVLSFHPRSRTLWYVFSGEKRKPTARACVRQKVITLKLRAVFSTIVRKFSCEILHVYVLLTLNTCRASVRPNNDFRALKNVCIVSSKPTILLLGYFRLLFNRRIFTEITSGYIGLVSHRSPKGPSGLVVRDIF